MKFASHHLTMQLVCKNQKASAFWRNKFRPISSVHLNTTIQVNQHSRLEFNAHPRNLLKPQEKYVLYLQSVVGFICH